MSLIRSESGWMLDMRPGGKHGKRIRRTFKRKKDAERYAAWAKTQATQQEEWEPPRQDGRRLKHLVHEWYEHHGKTLKDGRNRKQKLLVTVDRLNDPIATAFKAEDFTKYRSGRLSDGVSANTMNHELAYLKAMFNELRRIGRWRKTNPLGNTRKLKFDEKEMTFLSEEEIPLLLEELKKRRSLDAYYITLICLETGARWSEAETLRAESIYPDRIVYSGTKSGKTRTVPISRQLYDLVKRKDIGRVFKSSYESFKVSIENLNIKLPKGQMTHVLRHTFASHFIMNGGNILTLQKILGHSTLIMTMRYAHLAPDHLEEAIQYKPLRNIDFSESKNGFSGSISTTLQDQSIATINRDHRYKRS